MARARDTSIATYRDKRDFSVTAEPAPAAPILPAPGAPIFVVQKHAAHRAGLHWDFRLEHGGVLWSWAVAKGPSLDPKDRRLAIHVEDHPLDYAGFQGRIPDGQYGAGTVDTWDRGTWEPLADPAAGMRDGELKFILHGQRLTGRFTLLRLKPRGRSRQEGWFLIKGHDAAERDGADAAALEAAVPALRLPAAKRVRTGPPAPGAKRAGLPREQAPQLARLAEAAPDGEEWISEIKFDGYRLLAWIEGGRARLVTRNLHDWTARLPAVAALVGSLGVETALLDGELVALKPDGTSSFSALQAALSAGADQTLHLYAFDLLHLNGWDLRPCRLLDRKAALQPLDSWQGRLRFSDHFAGDAAAMRRQACASGLEGIICKRADAPYRAGRSGDWLKVKCRGREEFVVLGWTPPSGSRIGIGALHLGFYDARGRLHYVGGVGTGFSEKVLAALRDRLDALHAAMPAPVLLAGDPLDPTIRWVEPELVAEVQYAAWSGSGRIRHAAFLGLREDKGAAEVVREIPDPGEKRTAIQPRNPARIAGPAKRGPKIAVPPLPPPVPPAAAKPAGRIVVAPKPKRAGIAVAGIEITHPDRALWPGITKRDLAEYWQDIVEWALPGLAHRPLAILRCPEGIAGEHFFQKRGHNLLPPQLREGVAEGSPYLAIDDLEGLVAMAQMSAIELHPWGASEADALHPDWLVFDLDPGDDVPFPDVVRAAHDLRRRIEALGLAVFPRTTGGKGLHLVVPVTPHADWQQARAFCRAFAELMSEQEPERFLPVLQKARRHGRILIDWLRNGLGATAVASFCPRGRPGATVATPLAWREVTPKLDPAAFTLRTIPARLAKLKRDPWDGFRAAARPLPATEPPGKPKTVRRPSDPDGRKLAVVYAPRAKR